MAIPYESDQEERAVRAGSAMDCLQTLLEGQSNDVGLDPRELSALLALVFDAARKAIPSLRFDRPGCNDD